MPKPMPRIRVCGPRTKIPEGVKIINTCSVSRDWSRGLSPFLLGPVALWYGRTSLNVENAWQYSKVYKDQTICGEPSHKWFRWAEEGWNNPRAVRYPMGKGAVPVFSYWEWEKLGYVEARKKIYCPLYSKAVESTESFETLKASIEPGKELWLWDYDGYDHVGMKRNLVQVLNDPKMKMGHAFVLAMLLTGQRPWED